VSVKSKLKISLIRAHARTTMAPSTSQSSWFRHHTRQWVWSWAWGLPITHPHLVHTLPVFSRNL